jgi:hypothetical protein
VTIQIPQYLQTKVYTARQDRQAFADVIGSPGVSSPGYLVPTSVGGLTMSFAAGSAWILGNNVSNQGMYRYFQDAAETRTVDAGDAQPRLDQWLARVEDSTENAGVGPDQSTLYYAKGLPTSGATLANRSGAVSDASLPNNTMRICDVLVPASAGAITSANIADRRTYTLGAGATVAALGSYKQLSSLSGYITGTDISSTYVTGKKYVYRGMNMYADDFTTGGPISGLFYWDPAPYAIPGYITKWRISAWQVRTSVTGVLTTAGVYRVSGNDGSGPGGTYWQTGTLAGSTVIETGGFNNVLWKVVGTDFVAPTVADWYMPAITYGTLPTSGYFATIGQVLEMRWTLT